MCGMLPCIFRISVAENRSDNLGCRSELGSDPPPTTAAGKSLGLHTECQTRKSHVGKSLKTRLTGDFYNHGAPNHLASIGNATLHETKNPRNIICKSYRLVKFGPHRILSQVASLRHRFMAFCCRSLRFASFKVISNLY